MTIVNFEEGGRKDVEHDCVEDDDERPTHEASIQINAPAIPMIY